MAKHNRNYGMLADGVLQYAPNPIKTDSGIIWTNEAAVYLEHGYKAIVFTEQPVKDGYSYDSEWTEREETIEQTWIEHEKIEPELPEE